MRCVRCAGKGGKYGSKKVKKKSEANLTARKFLFLYGRGPIFTEALNGAEYRLVAGSVPDGSPDRVEGVLAVAWRCFEDTL